MKKGRKKGHIVLKRTREKISKTLKRRYAFGYTQSEETRRKNSESKKGNKYALGSKRSEETLKRMRESHLGKKKPDGFGKKMSIIRLENPIRLFGDKNPNWNGGSSFEPYGIEFNKRLKRQIKERDNYTCQICGKIQRRKKKNSQGILDVHHIDYNKENNKESNLITLCKSCHRKTSFNRDSWQAFFEVLIKKIYKTKLIKVNSN